MRRTRLLAVACLLAASQAGLLSCSECDDLNQCDDSCDEQYPSDDAARSACYQQCEQSHLDCLDRDRGSEK